MELKDWDSIRSEWFHTAGGFNMASIRKLAEGDPNRVTIQFDLRPGEEFGWVLPKLAKFAIAVPGRDPVWSHCDAVPEDELHDAADMAKIKRWIAKQKPGAPNENGVAVDASSSHLGGIRVRVFKNQSTAPYKLNTIYSMLKKDWDSKLLLHTKNIDKADEI